MCVLWLLFCVFVCVCLVFVVWFVLCVAGLSVCYALCVVLCRAVPHSVVLCCGVVRACALARACVGG